MIDGVGGVSMGAFVGAMDASGVDADEMDALLRGVGAASRAAAYTVLRHALIRGARVEAMLGRVLGTVAIEELRRGPFCASADLRSGQFVVSRFGPPAESVGLSMRLPVLAPGQVRGRRELVDGSLIDNLPLSTLAALGEGPLITVDVKASFDREGRTKHRRAEIRAPSLAETLIRVLRLASSNTSAAARRYADLTIEPRSEGVRLLKFHQPDRAREAGRREARRRSTERGPPRSRILARGLPGLLG